MPSERLNPKNSSSAERNEKKRKNSSAVRVTVHRLRQRYRELVRAEIAGTVSSLSEVEDELSLLLQSIRG